MPRHGLHGVGGSGCQVFPLPWHSVQSMIRWRAVSSASLAALNWLPWYASRASRSNSAALHAAQGCQPRASGLPL